jgi:hypothetical protein
MKKVLMLIAVILGTSVMVSAKTTPTKSMVAKEVITSKHHKTKEEKKEAKAEKKAAKAEKKAEVAKAKK